MEQQYSNNTEFMFLPHPKKILGSLPTLELFHFRHKLNCAL